MAGLSFFFDEYKKDPTRIEKLLDGDIVISEKLSSSRFCAQKSESNGFIYYKRNDNILTKIDRTLSKYYEKAITHFDSLDEETLEKIPDGWRFGMEYFPNNKPVTIAYDRLPLNNLVLTDIQVKDPKDRTIDVITDKKTLKKWADIIQVENPPIFYEGKLSDEQKRKFLDFLNTPKSDLLKRFKTDSFTSFVLKTLNPEIKNTFLNDDLEKNIDGLVFKFNNKEVFKVDDKYSTETAKKLSNEKPSDIYNLTLVFIQEFITMLDFKKIRLYSNSYEDRYIEFISNVYNRFLQTPVYKNNYETDVNFDMPAFLTREESNSDFNFVTNPDTLKLLKKSNTNRELFKIFLASLRSRKKKPSGFFTKELLFNHNQIVDKIADFCSKNVLENTFYSFDEFKSVYLSESLTLFKIFL